MRRITREIRRKLEAESLVGLKICPLRFFWWIMKTNVEETALARCSNSEYLCCKTCPEKNCDERCAFMDVCDCSYSPAKALSIFMKNKKRILKELPLDRYLLFIKLLKGEVET